MPGRIRKRVRIHPTKPETGHRHQHHRDDHHAIIEQRLRDLPRHGMGDEAADQALGREEGRARYVRCEPDTPKAMAATIGPSSRAAGNCATVRP